MTAPVVPCFLSEVSSPRDWRMVRSLPPIVISTSAACESMKPRDCSKGTSCEKMMNASGGLGPMIRCIGEQRIVWGERCDVPRGNAGRGLVGRLIGLLVCFVGRWLTFFRVGHGLA